jgi:hypothetical protein
MTKSKKEFIWNEDTLKKFNQLKQSLVEAPILAFSDFKKPFIIHTDASNQAIGAVLLQMIQTILRSRSLLRAES